MQRDISIEWFQFLFYATNNVKFTLCIRCCIHKKSEFFQMSMLHYLLFYFSNFLRYQIIAIQSLNVQNVLVYPSIRRARIFCITIKYRRWHFANIYVYEKAFRTETNLQTEGKGIHKFMLYFATLEYFGKRYILDTFVHFTLYHLSVCSWYFHYYKANSFCVLIKYSSWYEITFSRY